MTDKEAEPHITFRGKSVHELSREELIEALIQALKAIHALNGVNPIPGFRRHPVDDS